jgi:hypothetical protein
MKNMYKLSFSIITALLPALLSTGCFAGGGLFEKGGHVYNPGIIPSATITRGAPYKIICYDAEKAKEYQANKESGAAQSGQNAAPGVSETPTGADKKKPADNVNNTPAVNSGDLTYISYKTPEGYKGECDEEGETSQFFLFNMFPATAPLSPDLAMSKAVQRLEGDTMINIRTWHEFHYYTVLGRVSVFKVKGTVIKFLSAQEQGAKEKKR